jgi:hypothetical protein
LKLGDLESKWREFISRLDIFNDKIEDQKKRLKEEIDKRIQGLATEVEKMYDPGRRRSPRKISLPLRTLCKSLKA